MITRTSGERVAGELLFFRNVRRKNRIKWKRASQEELWARARARWNALMSKMFFWEDEETRACCSSLFQWCCAGGAQLAAGRPVPGNLASGNPRLWPRPLSLLGTRPRSSPSVATRSRCTLQATSAPTCGANLAPQVFSNAGARLHCTSGSAWVLGVLCSLGDGVRLVVYVSCLSVGAGQSVGGCDSSLRSGVEFGRRTGEVVWGKEEGGW